MHGSELHKMWATLGEWIPVGEALPKGGDCYLVYRRDDGHEVAIFGAASKSFLDIGSLSKIGDVTHWQPLPDPPKLAREDD